MMNVQNEAVEKAERVDATSPTGPEEQLHTLADVNISGIGRVFGRNVRTWQRIVWAVVLVTCFGLTLSQVWDRVTYYKSTPVNVNVRVTRNVSLLFPLVTFCNKNFHNMSAMKELQQVKARILGVTDHDVIRKWKTEDLIGVNGMTPMDVWDAVSHDINQILSECWFGRGVKCHEVGEWKKLYTVLGICYQFRIFEPVYVSGIFNNMYVKLFDPVEDNYDHESGFKVHIHDPKDDAIIDVRTHGSSVDHGWGKDARVAVREFKTIPTYTRPCITEPDYSSSKCMSRCFIGAMYNKTGCLMPYMEGYIDGAKPCFTTELYKLSAKTKFELLFQGGWRPTSCRCQKQCYENIYTIYTEAVQTGFVAARIRVFFQDLTYDEVSEELAYDTIALLCDIGGTLGLLLGASVLTIFEFVEIGWERVTVLCRKRKL